MTIILSGCHQAEDHQDGRPPLQGDGIDGSGIAAVMRDAGLTNGAFYTHFTSRDDLVATTIANQLQAQNAR